MRMSDWSSDVCSSDLSARDDDAADDQAGARPLVLVLFGRADVAIAIAEFGAAPVVHPDMARGIAPLPPGVATSTKPAHQLDPIVRRDIALLIAVVARFTANRPRIIFDRLRQRRGITAIVGIAIAELDRKSVLEGTRVSVRVDPGGRRYI